MTITIYKVMTSGPYVCFVFLEDLDIYQLDNFSDGFVVTIRKRHSGFIIEHESTWLEVLVNTGWSKYRILEQMRWLKYSMN